MKLNLIFSIFLGLDAEKATSGDSTKINLDKF